MQLQALSEGDLSIEEVLLECNNPHLQFQEQKLVRLTDHVLIALQNQCNQSIVALPRSDISSVANVNDSMIMENVDEGKMENANEKAANNAETTIEKKAEAVIKNAIDKAMKNATENLSLPSDQPRGTFNNAEYLECAAKLVAISALLIECKIKSLHEQACQSLPSTTEIILSMNGFFEMHIKTLLSFSAYIPNIVEMHSYKILDTYFSTRKKLLSSHLTRIFSSSTTAVPIEIAESLLERSHPTLNVLQPSNEDMTSHSNSQQTFSSNHSDLQQAPSNHSNLQQAPSNHSNSYHHLSFQGLLLILVKTFEDELAVFNSIFSRLSLSGEPFYNYFYQTAVLPYKLLMRRKIFSFPSVHTMHQSIFEILCKIQDSFLKRAIFINTQDQIKAYLMQLWNDFINQEDLQDPEQQTVSCNDIFSTGLKFFDLFLFFDDIKMQQIAASLLASIPFNAERITSQYKILSNDEPMKLLRYLVDYLVKSGFKLPLRLWIDMSIKAFLIPAGFRYSWITMQGSGNMGRWKDIEIADLESEFMYMESKPVDL